MSSNCTFDFHVANVYKRCFNLTGWILRTFNTRETISMMTLFKSLVLSRLDYASQLWSPHLLKSIYLIEKVQRSFTKHITGIKNKPYDKRLKLLNLYSVQRRRDRYQIIWHFYLRTCKRDKWRTSAIIITLIYVHHYLTYMF